MFPFIFQYNVRIPLNICCQVLLFKAPAVAHHRVTLALLDFLALHSPGYLSVTSHVLSFPQDNKPLQAQVLLPCCTQLWCPLAGVGPPVL